MILTEKERKDRNRVASAKWKKNHPEKVKAAGIAWRKNHPEEIRVAHVAWKKAHPEKVRAAIAKWQKTHPKKVQIRNTAWRNANPEKAKAASATWRKANPDKAQIIQHNKRARKKANGGKLSPGIISKLLSRQKTRCAICRTSLKKTGHHLDHIIPLTRGGKNIDSNIQLTCPTCNMQKNARDPIEFMQSRGYLL